MFTGIVGATGKVVRFEGGRLWARVPFRLLQFGESISVDGVCLTVAARKAGLCAFDVGPETLRRTTLGALTAGAAVNLERALRVGDRLGGHWVTGHIEGTGRVLKFERAGANRWLDIAIPPPLARWVISQGSIAVDGISLTVASRKGNHIRVMIVPYTLGHTTLSIKRPGDHVNIETDLLAKYAAQALRPRHSKTL